MKDNTIIKVAAVGFIGLVVVPTVVGAGMNLIASTANGISNLAYKRKIKKGLENGSIVEIDGQYYEIAAEEA